MIELELLQNQLGKKGKLITQSGVDELNKLVEDPEYGEMFLEQYINYFNILEKNSLWSTPKYLSAMKFFTLVEQDHSFLDAYVKVFPDRLANRLRNGGTKSDMGGEASRYNASQLVNEIRKVALPPVQLIHKRLLHKAILVTANMMEDPTVSPAVRQKAAETLIRELKPSEDSTVTLKVGLDEESKSQQARLVEHIGRIAMQQREMLAAGLDIVDIQKLNINVTREDIVDVRVEE